MKNWLKMVLPLNTWIFLFVSLFVHPANVTGQDLKGYYTRLDFDDSGITGKYADIVIEIKDKGQFIFSREYSYQPYWLAKGEKSVLVERLIPRKGDGTAIRPDRNNICSNAAIVSQSDTAITVHWRYAPDLTKLSFLDFQRAYNEQGNPSSFYAEYADEYFTVHSDGRVSRTAKEGCYRLDEWKDPKNQFTQKLRLTTKGIKQQSLTRPTLSNTYGTEISGASLRPVNLTGAIMQFKFDEALSYGDGWAMEEISTTPCAIVGVEDYWEKGVSGTCLFFDSYSNGVKMPSEKVPAVEGDFSICGWVAPFEYPFNTAAFMDHLNGNRGYLLGMNRLGEVEFRIGDGSEVSVVKTNALPLYTWTHVVATCSLSSGMKIYLNGRPVAEKAISVNMRDAMDTELSIGMTNSFTQFPYGAEREVTKGFRTHMVFSGMIDELMVFSTEFQKEKIDSLFMLQKPDQLRCLRPYVLPSDQEYKATFGASYTQLNFHRSWDGLWRTGAYTDLVVNFEDQPWRFVFWRGTRYLPSLVTDYGRSGIWSNDQSPEAFKGLCYEHMSDMLCRYSNIRLISSSPARVIVHWRNASADIAYRWPNLNDKGQGIWTDEYWTIYPDGTSVRHQLLHNSIKEKIIEMNQNEILLHPGQQPEDAIMNEAVTLGDEKGNLQSRSRLGEEAEPQSEGFNNLLYTHLNSSTKQFQIGELGTRIETHLDRDVWWNGWNHYPVQLIPSDGTRAIKYDRPASFCPSTFREFRRNVDEVTIEAMQIYGLTRLSPEELLPLNKYWNFTPQISETSGCEALAYNKAEKAYYLKQTGKTLTFLIPASQNSPLVNPAFVIQNMNESLNHVEVKVNGKKIACKSGIEVDTKGHSVRVIWMEYSSNSSSNFEIR